MFFFYKIKETLFLHTRTLLYLCFDIDGKRRWWIFATLLKPCLPPDTLLLASCLLLQVLLHDLHKLTDSSKHLLLSPASQEDSYNESANSPSFSSLSVSSLFVSLFPFLVCLFVCFGFNCFFVYFHFFSVCVSILSFRLFLFPSVYQAMLCLRLSVFLFWLCFLRICHS